MQSAGKVLRAVAKEMKDGTGPFKKPSAFLQWLLLIPLELQIPTAAPLAGPQAEQRHCWPPAPLLSSLQGQPLSAGSRARAVPPAALVGLWPSLGSSPTPAARERRAWPGTPTQPDRAVHAQQDVGALQIPVDHPVGMEEIQALQTLRENEKHEGKNQWLE